MFENLLERIESIPVEERDLDQFFMFDSDGRDVTLGEYLDRSNERVSRLNTAGTARAKNSTGNTMHALSEREIGRLVEQYLSAFGDDEVLNISGQGSFTADDLRGHVREGTQVGERLVQIVVRGRRLMEAAAERGKVKVVKKHR